MAIIFEKGTRFKDPLYLKIRQLHLNMKSRCNNPNNWAYKWYGGRGVYVCKEWENINGFISTIESVDGFDLEKFMKGELELDKDFKNPDSKLYSPSTCTFLSKKENKQHKPSYQKDMLALSPDNKFYEFTNQKEFAIEHNLYDINIRDGLSGKSKLPHGWLFRYKNKEFTNKSSMEAEKIKLLPKVIEATSPNGDKIKFTNMSKFVREQGGNLERKSIRKYTDTGKSYKGWYFNTIS